MLSHKFKCFLTNSKVFRFVNFPVDNLVFVSFKYIDTIQKNHDDNMCSIRDVSHKAFCSVLPNVFPPFLIVES